jgi:hypothetical protein
MGQGVNTLSVCLVEDIAAQLGEVWSLLVDPGKLMVPGQLIDAAPLGSFQEIPHRIGNKGGQSCSASARLGGIFALGHH